MSTNAYVLIEPNQMLVGRPFTDGAHAAEDVRWLRGIVGCLRHVLAELSVEATATSPYVFRHHEPDGRACRVVVCKAGELKRNQDLAVVGFFGQKRSASAAVVDEIMRLDEGFLVEEFLQHPLIVAYCTQQLPDGNYANLVLMSHLDAKRQWEGSERHRYAAFELAPHYYATVRIHNFDLPGGVHGPQLMLQRTKYYDYAEPAVWRGIREQTPPVAFTFA